MGVYIFLSLIQPKWFKVGHHRITPRRPNVWYRVARRGFKSVKGPPELKGFTDIEHLDLLRFYPNLTSRDEKKLHRLNKQVRIGEWYPSSDLPRILEVLEKNMGGIAKFVTLEEKNTALAWAGKIKKSPLLKKQTKKLNEFNSC